MSNTAIATRFSRLRRGLRSVFAQHLTVKIIPESAQEARSFRINVVVLVFSLLLLTSVAVGSIHLLRTTREAPDIMSRQQSELVNLQANLDEALGELQGLLRAIRPVDEELEITFAGFGNSQRDSSAPAAINRTQFADFFQGMARDATPRTTSLQEVEELRSLVNTLESSMVPLAQTRSLLSATENYLRDVPHFWPVANGAGTVTMEYGPNIHPFTGQWYLHKGFDVAGPVGLPLVAAADGVVVESRFDIGYGNVVTIRHRYGFHTLYAHLHNVSVREGQRVSQGERIGTMGSSGFSTGTHLHFEIIIGNEVLDPAPFLKISNTFERGGHAASRRP